MTEYGTIINNQLIVHKAYRDGDKPLKYTDEPKRDGYYTTYEWFDNGNEIEQKWELHEIIDYPEEEEEATEDDYKAALAELGVTE